MLTYVNHAIDYHRFRHSRASRAISLHIFTQPLETCKAWNESTRQEEFFRPGYTSLNGELLPAYTTNHQG